MGYKGRITNAEDKISERMQAASMSRLEAIASLKLGSRSRSAKRVMEKRARRKELMQMGCTFYTACEIVNEERKHSQREQLKSNITNFF